MKTNLKINIKNLYAVLLFRLIIINNGSNKTPIMQIIDYYSR
jgi:hypothetical protein